MLDGDVLELVLARYEANIGAMKFEKQKGIIIQQFELSIALSPISFDVD